MATINTAALPTKSDLDSMQYVDEDSPKSESPKSDFERLGHDGYVAAVNAELEKQRSETIDDEFLDDDIFHDDDDEETVEQVESIEVVEVAEAVPQNEIDATPEQLPAPVIEVSPQTQVVEIVWDEEAEKRKDEAAFFDRLRELNVAIDTAEENLEEAKEEAKLAKATLNLAIANQKHFTSKGVQYRKKPVPQLIAEPSKPSVEDLEAKVAAADLNLKQGNIEPVAIPESEWRAWETETILDGIEGLGAKKRETLIEHFPTFGKLMDARTEAGKEHVPFHTLLPKGIGEAIGTVLVDRMDAKIVPGM